MEIWHNPRCSKSRQARALLADADADVTEVRYLDDPPTADRLREVVAMLGIAPGALVRRADARKLDLPVGDLAADDEAWFDLMAEHPAIIERPVVVTDDGRAVVGRPPELVSDLLGRP